MLEDILEATKPAVPDECAGLHYLYATPFRYGAYPKGSRFRRAGRTPGVLYASQSVETALAETAFHLLLFYADSPDTPFPENVIEYSAFDLRVRTQSALDLRAPPLDSDSDVWTHLTDYAPTQAFAETARDAGAQILLYPSVRDPGQGTNVAVLTCAAFASKTPRQTRNWRLHLGRAGVDLYDSLGTTRFNLPAAVFTTDPRIRGARFRA